MPKVKEPKKDQCRGGASWGCHKAPHDLGQTADVHCYRCQTRLGCSDCCQPARELLCLRCHNWGTRIGVSVHGDIVASTKVPRVRTDKGWKIYDPADPARDVNRLLTQLATGGSR